MKRRAAAALTIAFALVMWITRWWSPETTATATLDQSYMQAFGHALKRGLQWGADIVFTYGPLGYFNSGPYDPDLYWAKVLAWELAFKLVLALLFARVWSRLSSKREQALAALVLLVPVFEFDAYFFLALLAATVWTLERHESALRRACCAAPVFVLIALVKFTYTALAGVCVLAIVVAIARRRSLLSGAAVVACFALVFVLIWAALGQSPANIAHWISSSTALSSAFSSAQALPAEPLDIALALLALACVAATVIAELACAERTVERLALGASTLAGLFVAFKAGFVRPTSNDITFFGYAGAAGYLLAAASARDDRGAQAASAAAQRARTLLPALRAASAVVGLTGFAVVSGRIDTQGAWLFPRWFQRFSSNAAEIADLRGLERQRAEERARLQALFDLPRVRARVGTQTIDVFGNEQGVVLLNGFNWHPRPVFQPYSVFTGELSEHNARFLESAAAPRFMLLRCGTIDLRLSSMEDSRSLEVLLRDYALVLAESGYLLFERDARAPRYDSDQRVSVRSATLGFGQWFDVDDPGAACDLLSLEITPTLAGRLATLCFKAPPLFLEFETALGAHTQSRIVPDMMRKGVLVHPWLENHTRWVRWECGEEVDRITRARVVAPEPAWAYEDAIAARLVRADALAPRPLTAEEARALRFSMFASMPAALEAHSPPERVLLRFRREVLAVFAPATLRFELAPGKYELQAEFGVFRHDGAAFAGSGTSFSVVLEQGGASRTLFERQLPALQPGQSTTLQPLKLDFEAAADARVLLRTTPGTPADAGVEWAFWSQVGFERAR